MTQIGEKPAKDVGYYCATHRVIFSALNYCQLCEQRTISTKEFEVAVYAMLDRKNKLYARDSEYDYLKAALATPGITVGE